MIEFFVDSCSMGLRPDDVKVVPYVGILLQQVGAECVSESIKHSYDLKPWEKDLQRIFDESNATKLTTMSKNSVKQYLSALPAKPGELWRQLQFHLELSALQCSVLL